MPTTDRSEWDLLQQKVAHAWIAARTCGSDVGTVVGCSGGADSVALVRALAKLWADEASSLTGRQGPLVIAHFNHALRGDASNDDESLVTDLAAELQLPLVIGRPGDASNVGAAEVDWRSMRRRWFVEAAAAKGCRIVALAHTLDDQVETVLHQWFRGSGPVGLSAMTVNASIDDVLSSHPHAQNVIIRRPMLTLRSGQIRDALRQNDWPHREDASNADTSLTRNWIRHELMPRVTQRFPQAPEAIARGAAILGEQNAMVRRLAEHWLQKHAVVELSPVAQWSAFAPAGELTDWEQLVWTSSVLVPACQLAWDQLGWPRREMSHAHWSMIATALESLSTGDPRSLRCPVLPGGVRWEATVGKIRWWREY